MCRAAPPDMAGPRTTGRRDDAVTIAGGRAFDRVRAAFPGGTGVAALHWEVAPEVSDDVAYGSMIPSPRGGGGAGRRPPPPPAGSARRPRGDLPPPRPPPVPVHAAVADRLAAGARAAELS